MAGLKVRGTTAAAGYLVFSVIDFIQGARKDTATYVAATLWFRGLRERAAYAEHITGHVVMVRLARGDCTYRTEVMSLRGLQMLLLMMGSHVEPEFRRIFEGILGGIANEAMATAVAGAWRTVENQYEIAKEINAYDEV